MRARNSAGENYGLFSRHAQVESLRDLPETIQSADRAPAIGRAGNICLVEVMRSWSKGHAVIALALSLRKRAADTRRSNMILYKAAVREFERAIQGQQSLNLVQRANLEGHQEGCWRQVNIAEVWISASQIQKIVKKT